MSHDLPRGWTLCPLRELAEISGGLMKGKKRKRHDTLRKVPYLRVANVQRGKLDLSEVKVIEATEAEIRQLKLLRGDILFNEGGDRDKLGRGCVWNDELPECINQNHVFRARVRDGAALPEWISAFGNSETAKAYFLTSGKQTTNLASISMATLGSLPIPTPPIREQHRIVAKLESLQARSRRAREALDAVPPLLEKLRQSILAAAFRGDLTKDWRAKHPNPEPATAFLNRIRTERRKAWEESELVKLKAKGRLPTDDRWKARYNEPEQVDTRGLPQLPSEWSWASLDELTLLVGGITKGQKRDVSADLRDVAYLRVANVQRGHLDLDEVKTIAATPAEIAELRLAPGDILLNEGGDRDKLGRGWVWEGQLEECIHQNHVFRARPVCDDIQSRYVSHFANQLGQSFFVDQGKQTTNLASVSMSRVRRLPIAVPPAPEQAAIVELVNKLFIRATTNAEIVARLRRDVTTFETSVLAKAFRGELVPQDPSDEPAEALLARLRGTETTPTLAKSKQRGRRTKAAE
jgi:type I restriction enzyme S subunit